MVGIRKLVVLDAVSAAWFDQQENGSLAIRELIHSQISTLKTGRPNKKIVYTACGRSNALERIGVKP